MSLKYLLVLAIQLGWVALGFANEDATITIPWVTDAPDYFKGYGGKVIGANDGTTTYGVNCLTDHTSCHMFTPDMTLVYGPSTYDMVAKGHNFDFTSYCTLIGSPTPTIATCTETKSWHQKKAINTATVIVPATGARLGIFPATLIVTDTGDLQETATATQPQPQPSASSDTLIANSSLTATVTSRPIPLTSNITVGYLNSTVTTDGDLVHFSNATLSANKSSATVTVTVLASPAPCRCECNCTETLFTGSWNTATPAMKNHAVKMAAPLAVVGGLVAVVFLNY